MQFVNYIFMIFIMYTIYNTKTKKRDYPQMQIDSFYKYKVTLLDSEFRAQILGD